MYSTHIKANKSWFQIDWQEIWEYRDLLGMLVKRDLTAVYKQTILGPLWFVIQPLVNTIIFTIIFGQVAKVPTDGMPQFMFYMTGTIMWTYFSGCMTQAGNSLIANMNVLKKVYFPRMVMPLSSVVTNLAHLGVNFLMFLGFYIYFLAAPNTAISPQGTILLFPLLVVYCALLGLAIGVWIAAMTTKYRDLSFALPFLTQVWMYMTPIVWPSSEVHHPVLRVCMWLNPMAFVVESCRSMFLGTDAVTWQAGAMSVGMTSVLLVSGILLFNRVQRTFVDTI
jgi:homopolymeric O-antigen transport system permease protein